MSSRTICLKMFRIHRFLDVEDIDINDARSEASFNSVACVYVLLIASSFGGGVKAGRNDVLGAWGLLELKTEGLNQKLGNAANVVDETQLCKNECTKGTLEKL